MSMDCCAATKKETEADRVLSDLHGVICTLEGRLGNLYSDLSDVLKAVPPEVCTKPDRPPINTSKLCERVIDATRRIEGVIEDYDRVMARLTV